MDLQRIKERHRETIEVRILDRLVWTLIFCIIMGMVGVVTGHVKVEYMEGMISGVLITMIGNLMKDLFFNDNKGDPNVQVARPSDSKTDSQSAVSGV